MAARLICERASDEEIGSLRTLFSTFEEGEVRSHLDEYSAANLRFHQRLIELGGREPAVVSAPVQPFVVATGNPCDVLERADSREYLHRPLGVATDGLPLSWAEGTRLVENPVRDAKLPDVV